MGAMALNRRSDTMPFKISFSGKAARWFKVRLDGDPPFNQA